MSEVKYKIKSIKIRFLELGYIITRSVDVIEEIMFKGFEDWRFFLHREINRDGEPLAGFCISELTTGARIAKGVTTELAKAKADQNMKRITKDRYKNMIDNMANRIKELA